MPNKQSENKTPVPIETSEKRTVRDTQSEFAELCLPNDTNMLGSKCPGGHVMHLVDVCGAIAAMRHSRCPVVTVSIDQMTFLHPVRLGELVRLQSQVNRVFRTSMEVGVKVGWRTFTLVRCGTLRRLT